MDTAMNILAPNHIDAWQGTLLSNVYVEQWTDRYSTEHINYIAGICYAVKLENGAQSRF